eukprot:4798862-Alexandrium_andersonii.AAC.1
MWAMLVGLARSTPAHLCIDNGAALLCVHKATAASRGLRTRPWQLRPNGDLQAAVVAAVDQHGRTAIRATG